MIRCDLDALTGDFFDPEQSPGTGRIENSQLKLTHCRGEETFTEIAASDAADSAAFPDDRSPQTGRNAGTPHDHRCLKAVSRMSVPIP